MNKFKLILLTSSVMLFTACGGGSSDPVSESNVEPVSIDFIGSWNYKLTTQNTLCDEFTAEGTLSLSESDSNTSAIGEFVINGNIFDEDVDGNCYLSGISGGDDISAVGLSKTQTLDELYNFFDDLLDAEGDEEGKDILDNIQYNSNSDSGFEISYTTPDGEIFTGVFTKL